MSSVKADSKIESTSKIEVNGTFVYVFGVPAQHPLHFLVQITLPLVFFYLVECFQQWSVLCLNYENQVT